MADIEPIVTPGGPHGYDDDDSDNGDGHEDDEDDDGDDDDNDDNDQHMDCGRFGSDPRWVHHRNSLPYGDDEDNDNDGDDDDDSDNDDGHKDDEDDDGDDDDNDGNDDEDTDSFLPQKATTMLDAQRSATGDVCNRPFQSMLEKLDTSRFQCEALVWYCRALC